MSTQPATRDLDLWLIDKDDPGVTKPGPGVVYDRAGIGIVFMDERGPRLHLHRHRPRAGGLGRSRCPPLPRACS